MKTCTKCNQEKNTTEFPKRSKSKDGLATWCKPCKAEADARNYRENPERKAAIRSTNDAAVAAKRDFIWYYLLQNPCIDCGEANPVVLEFDHVRGQKVDNIARMIFSSWDALYLEIQKCDVRCANCHRIVTYERAGSWRSLFSDSGSTFLS